MYRTLMRTCFGRNRPSLCNTEYQQVSSKQSFLICMKIHLHSKHLSFHMQNNSSNTSTQLYWNYVIYTITSYFFLYILLTVHHAMILVKWPTWRTILFCVFIYIFNSLHVSSTSCSSSGETDCVNTTSGSCHSVSVAVSCAGRS